MNSRNTYTSQSPSVGGAYSEGLLGPIETLNPIFASSSAEKSAARLLFASLYNYDSTGRLKGDLAESVSVNDAETEYTIKLLPNIVWSDGAPLTSADVDFTINLLKDPAIGMVNSGWGSIKVEVQDARTIKFILSGAYAPFMHALRFPILPEHVLAGVKASELREQPFSQSPVTSGPFALRMLQNVASDGSKKIAHFVANPHYRHGTPKLERFQLNAYASRDDIITALKTNEIMATPELFYNSLPEAIRQNYRSEAFSINNGVFAIFNNKSEPLKSVKVREALALSIDRQKLIGNINRPAKILDGPILDSQVISGLPGYPKQNIERSKELLDGEGWTVKDGIRHKGGEKMKLKMVALKGDGFGQTTEALANTWRKQLNISVDVQIVDPADPSQNALQSVLQPRNFDVLVHEFVLGADPDVYDFWHSSGLRSSGLNFASYSNAVVDDALLSGVAKLDERYRSGRYEAFVKRWLVDFPAVPLYQPKIDYISTKSVSSLGNGSTLVYPEDRFSDVIYWSVVKSEVYKSS